MRVPSYMIREALLCKQAIALGSVFDRVIPGPGNGAEFAVKEEEPRIKGPKPKVRKLAKGLRP